MVAVNLKEILRDHRDRLVVQRYLDQWRLALKGDKKRLADYYQKLELGKFEGITQKEFLDRAARIKKIGDSLGIDPLTGIDQITIGAQIRPGGFVAVIVEGRFEQAKVTAGLKALMPAVREWLGPQASVGVSPDMILLADSKKTLAALQAQEAKKTAALPKGIVALAESGAKEHVCVVVNQCDAHAQALSAWVKGDVAEAMSADDVAGKFFVLQSADWLRKNAADFAAAGLAVSWRDDAVRLQLSLDAKKLERAREMRSVAGNWGLWGGLGLRAVNDELGKQLGDILMRIRVTGDETTVVVHADVPAKFIESLSRRAERGLDSQASPIAARLAARMTSIPLWTTTVANDENAPDAIIVERDIAYRTGAGSDPIRHRLDMYLPRNKKDFPIVVLVHGGAWTIGDNRSAGLYPSVAQFLASQGIGVVLPNYRLSPAVKHPEHVKDVARAVSWTKAIIGKRGGDLRRLFLMGHSAGAHLVALLATDDSYLRSEKMDLSDIKGVMAVSGVYKIDPGNVYGSLGGSGPRALRIERLLPMRGDSSPSWTTQLPGLPLALDIYGPAFGADVKGRLQASPITHVRRGVPPFRLFVAEHDLPTLSFQAEQFDAAVRKAGSDAKLLRMEKRNHNSLLFSVITPQDPAAEVMLKFINK